MKILQEIYFADCQLFCDLIFAIWKLICAIRSKKICSYLYDGDRYRYERNFVLKVMLTISRIGINFAEFFFQGMIFCGNFFCGS